ncbi:MAG TPA: zinc ribbon domain-containing protein [Candidatus Sulfotelmatobacter sp.]|nr:zinc ribbon domain-containing protein [Candidatus Sulfotelmatobacter sp.]
MAFCNKCGTAITQGTRFCNKCGAPILASGFSPVASSCSTPNPTPVPTQAAPQGGSNALKVVLIVVGAVIVIGVLGLGALTFIGVHIAKRSRMHQDGDRVKVETPFGTVESTKDPEQAAKNLGIDIYPGAQVQKEGASSALLGNIRTVSVNFESSDSVDKVCSFYKARFPNANVSTSEENHCTIVSTAPPNVTTINVESRGSGSKFQISTVAKK